MKRIFAFAALCLSLGSAALAQTITPAPSLLSYQGRIAKPDGTPVPDTTSPLPYTLRLSLWDAATGGTKKWEQIITVNVKNGVFSALLDLGANAGDILNGNVWMETKIGNDAPLSPRQQIVSVAYALKANTVPDSAITTSKIANNAVNSAKLFSDAASLSKVSGGFLQRGGSGVGVNISNSGTSALSIKGTPASISGEVLDLNSGAQDQTFIQWERLGTTYWFTGVRNDNSFSIMNLLNPVLTLTDTTRRVGIGTTNPSALLGVYASGIGASDTIIKAQGGETGTDQYKLFEGTHGQSTTFYVRGDGLIFGQSLYQWSDARYKKDIEALGNPLSAILGLRGVSYGWNNDTPFGKGRQIGFIAQELEKVLPELVHTDSKGYKAVNYVGIVPVLVEAVKAQQAQINRLSNAEKKNIELEARIKQLEAAMERLTADKR